MPSRSKPSPSALEQIDQHIDLLEAECRETATLAFVGRLCQRLRGPVATLLDGTDELFRSGGPWTQSPALQQARSVGRSILQALDDFQDLAELESGAFELQSAPCSIVHLLQATCDPFRERAAGKEVHFSVYYETDLPEAIESDAGHLARILSTLIDSALRHTQRGGVRVGVRLESGAGATGEDRVGAPAHDDATQALTFEVSDTGGGLDARLLEHLQRPSLRLADALGDGASESTADADLGLLVARGLIEALGGELHVRSSAELGTATRFTLPCGTLHDVRIAPAEELLKSDPGGWPTPQPLRCRVLLAEDDETTQRKLFGELTEAGARVSVACNGRDVLRLHDAAIEQGEPFDVIFVDLIMPQIDGAETARQLRERGCRAAIIALTDKALRKERDGSLEAGCDAFITPPYDRKKLALLIRSSMPTRRSRK